MMSVKPGLLRIRGVATKPVPVRGAALKAQILGTNDEYAQQSMLLDTVATFVSFQKTYAREVGAVLQMLTTPVQIGLSVCSRVF